MAAMLAAEDADLLLTTSGVAAVAGPERLPADLGATLFRSARPLYVPCAPEEGERTTRDSARSPPPRWAAVGPVRRRRSRLEAELADGLRRRLSAARRAATFRRPSTGCGFLKTRARARPSSRGRWHACAASQRSKRCVRRLPACAVRARGGRRLCLPAGWGEGCRLPRDRGRRRTNAWYGHYGANDAALARRRPRPDGLRAGLPLLHVRHRADVAGERTLQRLAARAVRGFVVDYHGALVDADSTRHDPGCRCSRTRRARCGPVHRGNRVLPARPIVARREAALSFRRALSHPVGMAVHDVGDYRGRPLEPGLVFSVDPMIWVTRSACYIRVEDTVAVTDNGVENLTGFVPLELDAVERVHVERRVLLKRWARSFDDDGEDGVALLEAPRTSSRSPDRPRAGRAWRGARCTWSSAASAAPT